jgi:deoxyribonuclease V
MLVAVDVQYAAPAVVTVAVGFADWSDPTSMLECVRRAAVTPAPYEPGAFYKRELSFLVEAVTVVQRHHPVEVVSSMVTCGYERVNPYLGRGCTKRSAERRSSVVGVAKVAFAEGSAVPVLRGSSSRPLFVSAAGINTHEAAELIRGMHGPHRLPTLLKRADRLAREHAEPDPAKALSDDEAS